MNLLSFAPRPSHVFFELAARCAPDLWGSNGSPSHPLHRSAVYCADRPRAGFPLELCSKNIFDKSQLHRVVYCFLLRCLSDPLRIQKWAGLSCAFLVFLLPPSGFDPAGTQSEKERGLQSLNGFWVQCPVSLGARS